MLFRSGQLNAGLVEDTLRGAEIQTVVDLRYWEEDPDMIAERAAISKLGLASYRFPLNGDGTGKVDNYVEALTVMHQSRLAEEPVLLHCAAGSQRTSGAFAFYNTLVLGQSAEQVVSDMQDYSWRPGRDQILLDYLNEHIAYVAEQLAARGIIESVPQELPVFESPNSFWNFFYPENGPY